jgi:rhodanese-related sulfurtransferase
MTRVCEPVGVSAFRDPEIEISVQEAAALLESGDAVLIDVREPHEWDAGRIPGRAAPAARDTSPRRAETIPRDTRVIFHCRLGNRSAMATQAFRTAGLRRRLDGGRHRGMARRRPADGPAGRARGHALTRVHPRMYIGIGTI